jgi:methylene-tetrahydromethanopterin dehydrogenase
MSQTEQNNQKSAILHLLTTAKNPSPFDVNMAIDAGFDQVIPYTHIELSEVTGLVQDAIFSRSPSGIKREGIFIGGRDIDLAMDMLNLAREAMVPPFAVSVFADPSGAFTTAAAMVANIEAHLKNLQLSLKGIEVSVFGATGPVGISSALLLAKFGAQVTMVSHRSLADLETRCQILERRYDVKLLKADGSDESLKAAILAGSDVAICAAAAGVRVLTLEQIKQSARLKLVADVNAVPPSGIEGLDSFADGALIPSSKVIGIGALAIGQIKYATQQALLKSMLGGHEPQYLDFISAFEYARGCIKQK